MKPAYCREHTVQQTSDQSSVTHTHAHTLESTATVSEGLVICMWRWLTNRGWCCIAGLSTEGHFELQSQHRAHHINTFLFDLFFITDEKKKKEKTMTPLIDDADIRTRWRLLKSSVSCLLINSGGLNVRKL